MMDNRFTCINCGVAFINADLQRNHYKTDWHRYNLNRKVAGFPPITDEEFQKKVIQHMQQNESESKDTALFCKVCRKVFASSKAFENHLNSKRHQISLNNLTENRYSTDPVSMTDISEPVHPVTSKEVCLGSFTREDDVSEEEYDSEIEEIDSDEWDEDSEEISDNNPILHNNCLFCSHHSATMTKNLNHMTLEHSFFIPDIDYLVDMRGLLLYLGEKVCKFYLCLWCDFTGRSFHSFEAAQQHMRDKGHCKVLYEGATLVQYCQFYNYATSYPDNKEGVNIDEEISLPVLDDTDFELTLPSGAKIGHRDLVVYYRQNLRTNKEVILKKPKFNKLMARYRALGWDGSDKEAVAKKARDMQYLQRVHSKYITKLGVKANKLQQHFRPQVKF